jgi:hypothetical protein
MSSRIKEGDFFYMGFWFLFMGGLMGGVLLLLIRIERNTRR